jgi:hypothetical protein
MAGRGRGRMKFRIFGGTAVALSVAAGLGLDLGLELGLELSLGLASQAHAQSAWGQAFSQDAPKDNDQTVSPQGSKDGPQDISRDTAEAQPAETGSADPHEVDMSGVDVNNLDWSQLNVDASTLANRPAANAKSSNAPRGLAGGDVNWSANDKPNGASSVAVKQSISPFWDTRIGADMTVTRQPTTMSELVAEKAENGGAIPQSSGTAWAAVTAPGAGSLWDKTSIEARVDPADEQSKLGTSISKAVPLNEQYSLTLQNGYNMTQQGVVPLPGVIAHPARSYETDQTAKLNIQDTGTSITAGQTLSSSDDRWLRKFGAEQKMLDGVSVSGAIAETSQGATSKSITAGFKHSW